MWEWEGVLAAAAHLNVTRYDACFYTLWNNYARLRSNLSSFHISIHIFMKVSVSDDMMIIATCCLDM